MKLIMENWRKFAKAKKIGNIVLDFSGSRDPERATKNAAHALKLIQKAPEWYQYIQNHLRGIRISQTGRTGAALTDAQINIRDDDILHRTSGWTMIWLASVIVHESIHIEQWSTGLSRDSTPNWETPAIIKQIEFLKAIGAPYRMIKYLRRKVKREIDHSDIDRDGDFDIEDQLVFQRLAALGLNPEDYMPPSKKPIPARALDRSWIPYGDPDATRVAVSKEDWLSSTAKRRIKIKKKQKTPGNERPDPPDGEWVRPGLFRLTQPE